MTKEEFVEMASIGIDTKRMVNFVEYSGHKFYPDIEFVKLESEIRELREKLSTAVEALEYYANHETVIKEAYHSNLDKQITCVHTFINHNAKEALEKLRSGK